MAQAFEEIQFPTDISYGATGGPEYSTDIVETHSGYEQRNVNWSQARHHYNVAHGVKTQAQLDTLLAFFHARKGRATGFRLKDWGDYIATGQNIGTGDGATTQFQLVKYYTSGAGVTARTIAKPIAGTVDIFVDAVEQTSGVSVDTATGIVTFTAAPANGTAITADFEFDVPVRFDTDGFIATISAFGTFSWPDIPVVEVRG